MSTLKGKVALITGAAHPKGMGFAAAKRMAQEGATIVLTDLAASQDNPMSDLEKTSAELQAIGGDIMTLAMDITDKAQIESSVANVTKTFGAIDILFNNAGIGLGSDQFLETTDNDWDQTYIVNLKGTVNCCQAVLPIMVQAGHGVIINNASLCGLGALVGIPAPYTALKHAIIGLTKSIAAEFGEHGIRCNAVCPGSIRTQMHANAMQRLAKQMSFSIEEAEALERDATALKKIGDPDEVGDVVAFLAGPGGRYITGIAIPVAGGMAPGL